MPTPEMSGYEKHEHWIATGEADGLPPEAADDFIAISFAELYVVADRVLTACGFYHLTPTRVSFELNRGLVECAWHDSYGLPRPFTETMFLGGELELVGAWFDVPVSRVNGSAGAQVSFAVGRVKVRLCAYGEPETEGDD